MVSAKAAKISPARWAAYKILHQVEKEKAFTSILLPLYEEELSAEDRGLCHELTLGVLRNQLFLDRLVAHFTGKKLEKLDLPVLLALRIGLYQIRFMTRIPARAAINESVELVKQERLVSAGGFVNAILRRAAREADVDPAEKITDEVEKLSVLTSHPRWLIERWIAEFGFDEAAKLTAANNKISRTSFRLNAIGDNGVLEELAASGVEFSESALVRGCFIVSRTNKALYEFAALGRIVLQDEASQMVARLADLAANESFLDVCAAPGNKTTQIINEARRNGVLSDAGFYAAGDIYPRRLETLRKNLRGAGIENVEIFEYDAEAALPFEPDMFDCILVDAPCSGTGTIRHNPEIRWSLRPDDILELAAKQKKILANAARVLKKGGRMIYSTCSLEVEENEQVMEAFLSENPGFEQVETNAPRELITGRGFVRTFPQRDNTDGFFAAILYKV